MPFELCNNCKLQGIYHKPGSSYKCADCKHDYDIHRRKNRRKKETIQSYQIKLRIQAREFILSQKLGKSCMDCGLIYEPHLMQFDHRDSSIKTAMLSQAGNRRWSNDRILLEIAKCDLVCIGCHRDRTQLRLSCSASIRSSLTRFKMDKFIKETKSGMCVDCGKHFPSWKMDYDHLPGSEKMGILSAAKIYGWGKQKILDEIQKCDLVCCWCHTDRTFRRQQYQWQY
jgi:hypothetical protein